LTLQPASHPERERADATKFRCVVVSNGLISRDYPRVFSFT